MSSETVKVRWLGESGGPDDIVQYGVEFPRKEWVDVPADAIIPGSKGVKVIGKLRGNRFFEFEGAEPEAETPAV